MSSLSPVTATTCPICTETTDVSNLISIDCGCLFHETCIRAWSNFTPTCPLDKTRITHYGAKKSSESEKPIPSKLDTETTTPTCSICQDEENTSSFVLVDCSHLFHKACIESWSKTSNQCPTCRHPMFEMDKKEQERMNKKREMKDLLHLQLMEAAGSAPGRPNLQQVLKSKDIDSEWVLEALQESSKLGETQQIKALLGHPALPPASRGKGLALAAEHGKNEAIRELTRGNPHLSEEDLKEAIKRANTNGHGEAAAILSSYSDSMSPSNRRKTIESLKLSWQSGKPDFNDQQAEQFHTTLTQLLPGSGISDRTLGNLVVEVASKPNAWSEIILGFLMSQPNHIPPEKIDEAIAQAIQTDNRTVLNIISPAVSSSSPSISPIKKQKTSTSSFSLAQEFINSHPAGTEEKKRSSSSSSPRMEVFDPETEFSEIDLRRRSSSSSSSSSVPERQAPATSSSSTSLTGQISNSLQNFWSKVTGKRKKEEQ